MNSDVIKELKDNNKEERNDYIAYGETKYDEEFLKSIYHHLLKGRIVFGIIGIGLSLFIAFIQIIAKAYSFLLIPAFMSLMFLTGTITIIVLIKKKPKAIVKMNGVVECKLYFYNDYVEVLSKALNGSSQKKLLYKDIKKKEISDNTLYLLFINTTFIVVKLDNIESKDKLLSLLNLNE